jgi:hypothetical protein
MRARLRARVVIESCPGDALIGRESKVLRPPAPCPTPRERQILPDSVLPTSRSSAALLGQRLSDYSLAAPDPLARSLLPLMPFISTRLSLYVQRTLAKLFNALLNPVARVSQSTEQ